MRDVIPKQDGSGLILCNLLKYILKFGIHTFQYNDFYNCVQNFKIKLLLYRTLISHGITPKRVTIGGDQHLRDLARGSTSSELRRDVTALASRLQHCVRFNRPGNSTQNLPH